MRCSKCGAENPDHSVYCGSCASELREAPDERPVATQPDQAERAGYDAAAEHKAQSKKLLRRATLSFGVLAVFWLLLGTVTVSDWELDSIDLQNLLFAGLFLLLSIYTYWISTDDEALSFIRLGGWIGRVRVEVYGVHLNSLIAGLGAIVILSMIFSHELGFVILSAAFIIAVVVWLLSVMLLWPPKVVLEDTGICIGYPSRNRTFIPFEKISSVELKRKVLRVSLKTRRPFGLKTYRFLLWGNIEDMREELDRVAPSGVPFRALAPSQMGAKPAEPEIVFTGPAPSSLSLAGMALIVAGLFAFMSAAGILILEGRYFTLGSTPLFCCGSFEVLCGAIAILGGMQTMRRVKYRLSVAASILAILSVGGLVVSPVLGVLALVIIYRNREDFRD